MSRRPTRTTRLGATAFRGQPPKFVAFRPGVAAVDPDTDTQDAEVQRFFDDLHVLVQATNAENITIGAWKMRDVFFWFQEAWERTGEKYTPECGLNRDAFFIREFGALVREKGDAAKAELETYRAELRETETMFDDFAVALGKTPDELREAVHELRAAELQVQARGVQE